MPWSSKPWKHAESPVCGSAIATGRSPSYDPLHESKSRMTEPAVPQQAHLQENSTALWQAGRWMSEYGRAFKHREVSPRASGEVQRTRQYNDRVDVSRVSQSMQAVQEMVADPEKQPRKDYSAFSNTVDTHLADGEHHFINKYQAAVDGSELRQKISDCAKAPCFQRDENPAGTTKLKRCTGFELRLTAQTMRAGRLSATQFGRRCCAPPAIMNFRRDDEGAAICHVLLITLFKASCINSTRLSWKYCGVRSTT